MLSRVRNLDFGKVVATLAWVCVGSLATILILREDPGLAEKLLLVEAGLLAGILLKRWSEHREEKAPLEVFK